MASATPEYADLIGKPFRYGGRGPHELDCYGLLMEMHRRDGIILPDYTSPEEAQKIAAVIAFGIRHWEEVEKPAQKLSVALRVKRLVSHVGYLISPTHFLHAWGYTGGVTLERLSDWRHRVVGFYRFVGEQ